MKKPCDVALEIIDSEEEPFGPMPDEMWVQLKDDREAIEDLVRAAIRSTKKNIRRRYLEHPLFQSVFH